jgi:DNA-binding MarR family transcriptional regulator
MTTPMTASMAQRMGDRPGCGGAVAQRRSTLKREQKTKTLGSPLASEAQQLLELLRQTVGLIFRQIIWRQAADLELTYSQAQVLYYVEQHPGCRMGEVAKAFGVTVSAITQSVDRLEQKKCLSRGTDPADRRVYTLDLTPAGNALVAELHTLQIESLEAVLHRMSARDRACVTNGLEILLAAASDRVPSLTDTDSAES